MSRGKPLTEQDFNNIIAVCDKPVTIQQIAEALDLSRIGAYKNVKILVKKGKIFEYRDYSAPAKKFLYRAVSDENVELSLSRIQERKLLAVAKDDEMEELKDFNVENSTIAINHFNKKQTLTLFNGQQVTFNVNSVIRVNGTEGYNVKSVKKKSQSGCGIGKAGYL